MSLRVNGSSRPVRPRAGDAAVTMYAAGGSGLRVGERPLGPLRGGIVSRGAVAVIGNAIIWGVVIISVSLDLKGTEYADGVRLTLGGGAAMSLLIVGAALGRKK